MIIDDSTGCDVNVSAILDEFLIDGTSSDVVIQFLSQHEDNLSEVWRYSDCYEKIFQIDYFLNSSHDVQEWIFKHLKKVPMKDAATFCWQCCSSLSFISEYTKNRIHREFNWILKNTKVKHPYSNSCESFIKNFDMWIFESLKEGNDFVQTIIDMPDNIFNKHAGWLTSSLFHKRIYQIDIFESLLSVLRQWLLIDKFRYMNLRDILDISSQIFGSSLDKEIKKACAKELTKSYHWGNYEMLLFKHDQDILKIVNSSRSFDEVQLELAMRGTQYPLKNILLYYFVKGNYKMIQHWWNDCHDETVQVYNLDFVNELANKK